MTKAGRPSSPIPNQPVDVAATKAGGGDETGAKATAARGAGAAVVVVVILLVLLPLFYVLSLGPAVWWVSRSGIVVSPDSAIARFYAPLEYANRKWPKATLPLEWYVELWRADPPMQSMPAPVAPPTVPAPPPAPTTTP